VLWILIFGQSLGFQSCQRLTAWSHRSTSAAKAGGEKEPGFRNAEALRHPKSSAKASFTATLKACPDTNQNRVAKIKPCAPIRSCDPRHVQSGSLPRGRTRRGQKDGSAERARTPSRFRAGRRNVQPPPSHIPSRWERSGTPEGAGAIWPTCRLAGVQARRVWRSYAISLRG